MFVYPTRVLKKSGTRVQGVGYPGNRVYPTSRNLHKIKSSDSNKINIYDNFEGFEGTIIPTRDPMHSVLFKVRSHTPHSAEIRGVRVHRTPHFEKVEKHEIIH